MPSNVIEDYNRQLNNEWKHIKENAITRLEDYLTTGNKELMFSKKEYMQFYTAIYNLSTTQIEHFPAELYKRYTDSIASYL